MHMTTMNEFEKLVSDIKSPLLIFISTRKSDRSKINMLDLGQLKQKLNIVDICMNEWDAIRLLRKHGLALLPTMMLYNKGRYFGGSPHISNSLMGQIARILGVE